MFILTNDFCLYAVVYEDKSGDYDNQDFIFIRKNEIHILYKINYELEIHEIFFNFCNDNVIGFIDKNNTCWLISTYFNKKFKLFKIKFLDSAVQFNLNTVFNQNQDIYTGSKNNYSVFILYDSGKLYQKILIQDGTGNKRTFSKKIKIDSKNIFKGFCTNRIGEYYLTNDGCFYDHKTKVKDVEVLNIESIHMLNYSNIGLLNSNQELFSYHSIYGINKLLENVVEIRDGFIITADCKIYAYRCNLYEINMSEMIEFKNRQNVKNARSV